MAMNKHAFLPIVFMGTPDFAVPSLQALIASGASLVGVYTQPPRPKGRGHQVQRSPVHTCALTHGLPVFTPASLNTQNVQEELAALRPQLLVVAAYGLILPPAVLAIPPRGAINVHASLLPRWRGAAPIQRAILAGDTETGVTLMEMEAGLDTGAMLAWETVPISPQTTAVTLTENLARLGAHLLSPTLEKWVRGQITSIPQPLEGVSYASKISREEGELLWNRPVIDLHRQVRALSPWPGTWLRWEGKRLKVLDAEIKEGPPAASFPPGTVVSEHLEIQGQDGLFRPLKVMLAGGKAMTTKDFLRGHPLAVGTCL